VNTLESTSFNVFYGRTKDKRTDGSVAISPCNFVGEGITKTIAKEINNRRKSKRKQQHQTNNCMLILNIFICPIFLVIDSCTGWGCHLKMNNRKKKISRHFLQISVGHNLCLEKEEDIYIKDIWQYNFNEIIYKY
jgi:hypothetical protein